MTHEAVKVNLGTRSYPIHIGAGAIGTLRKDLAASKRRVFVLCDSNTRAIAESLGADIGSFHTVPAGERSKGFSVLEEVMRWLATARIDRSRSVIVAVGGGVIGDLAGFAAAIIMRGVPFIQVPTSLLAQVDSSVGGKTGINLPEGKNLVGSFHQPEAVYIDTDVLKTLPERELRAGYAEILKYALLGDAGFFDWLEENAGKLLARDAEALTYAIKRSCQMKADIVAEDEREQGRRALLNLGHTFGHALEALAGYDGRLIHGEAVFIGMHMAAQYSVAQGLCGNNALQAIDGHYERFGLPKRIEDIVPDLHPSADQMLEKMRKDKKVSGATLRLILLRGIGEAFMHDISDEDTLRAYLS